MFRQLTVALAATLIAAGTTQAATLIDTGTPDGSQFATAVDASNWVAVRFDAAEPWRIDGVAAYLVGANAGDHFALSLYQDAPDLPGDLVASTTVSFAADGWNSAQALGWQLTPGHYWLGVEGLDGAFNAPSGGLVMPGATAFADGSQHGAYQAYAGLQFGLQVTGAVPEPASLALLLAGMVGLGVATRARRQTKR